MSIIFGCTGVSISESAALIISSVDAEPLRFAEGGGLDPLRDLPPLPRALKIEGYFLSPAASESVRVSECTAFRKKLSALALPNVGAYLIMDDRRAQLESVQVKFSRTAPFSGDGTEHFTITANIKGGRFLGASSTKFASSSTEITLTNGGDLPVPFTATLFVGETSTHLSIEDAASGKKLTVTYLFEVGDQVRICTDRGALELSLTRGTEKINISGYASRGSSLFPIETGETTLTLEGVAKTGTYSLTEAHIWY